MNAGPHKPSTPTPPIKKAAIRAFRSEALALGNLYAAAVCTLYLEGAAAVAALPLSEELRAKVAELDASSSYRLVEQWIVDQAAATDERAALPTTPPPPPEPPPAVLPEVPAETPVVLIPAVPTVSTVLTTPVVPEPVEPVMSDASLSLLSPAALAAVSSMNADPEDEEDSAQDELGAAWEVVRAADWFDPEARAAAFAEVGELLRRAALEVVLDPETWRTLGRDAKALRLRIEEGKPERLLEHASGLRTRAAQKHVHAARAQRKGKSERQMRLLATAAELEAKAAEFEAKAAALVAAREARRGNGAAGAKG